ncbi:MAG: exonuclease domain-containing protein [Firmicutes bacterium]|nr:exonuclease domain-containing protein [Bacillota bacterium]
MNYTILDLEWNSVFSPRLAGYFNEIIQFGAVRLDENLQLTDTFSTFVQPSEGKKLTELVMQLTNIRNEDLQDGLPFPDAFHRFTDFLGDSVLMTWGTCDIRELIHNYRFFTGKNTLPLRGGYINLQAYCQQRIGGDPSQQMGLSAAAEALSIDASAMSLHRAIDDSILSAECFRAVYDPEALKPFLMQTDEEFYRRLAFKNKYLTDLSHPLVDRSKLNFRCPKCGGKLKVLEPWALRGKQFWAKFRCEACRMNLKAFAQFQQRFDGVRVRRRITPEQPPETMQAEQQANISVSSAGPV